MPAENAAFLIALRQHDERLAQSTPAIWLGSEPTFTDRAAETPEWLSRAEGGEKAGRAVNMLKNHCQGRQPAPLLLRSIGRQYAGEKLPRWSYGLYQRRDGQPVWHGPPDPALGGEASTPEALASFPTHLQSRLQARGWHCIYQADSDKTGGRLVFRVDGGTPTLGDSRLERASIHAGPIPEEGLSDPLAADGVYLLLYDVAQYGDAGQETRVPRLELPDFASVPQFLQCLASIAAAAQAAGLNSLILQGFPPPVDASVAWVTLTPDPAVIEVNMAPARNAQAFYLDVQAIYRAAEEEGLSPYRFYYNGDATDSGGGGQITFGGPSPEASPFLVKPWLLPNVVRYFNRHPALSYFFTPTCVGSSSQSPRPDERLRESFDEMRLTLELLSRLENPDPALLWGSLAPFLSDPSGNNHRSEINIEKLWNPLLPGRGCLGLVEFRAFRMARTPEMLTARAVLFRSVLAMLAAKPLACELTDWGGALHDRFALPYYLRLDLADVLDDLARAGFGLPPVLTACLFDDRDRVLGELALDGYRLTVKRALEFWPLVGDVASQESGNSRLIDSSTSRLELLLRPDTDNPLPIDGWQAGHRQWQIPLRVEQDSDGPLLLLALRYRAFTPWRGLHPCLGPQSPLELRFRHRRSRVSHKLQLHEWNPQGLPYPSLPQNWAESEARRQERLVLQTVEEAQPDLQTPPAVAVTPYCLDVRAY